MRSFYALFARNTVFANIVMVLIFLLGFMGIMNMNRETFPEFSLDMVMVRVVWPGADPEEVEEGICIKIEEGIEGIEGVKQYNSVASENMGMVLIEVIEGFPVAEVKEKVRNAVDAISTFPEEAEKPVTEEMLLRDEVLQIALSGDHLTEKQLKEWAEEIKDELLSLPEVSQVKISGARDYEISIEVSEERLREYGLNFQQVSNAVRANSVNLSGGVLRSEGEEIRLRTLGRKYTGEEFAKIVVLARPNGEVITLDRIATIKDGFSEDLVVSKFNGNPALSLAILKTTSEDTLTIDEAVREYVKRKQETLPEGMYMTPWAGFADALVGRINLLVWNGIQGLILVVLLLWLFLDIRLSFWIAMGIPTSIMGAIAIMWMVGITINMLSLFGLIMVLGIVVDDAIVISEAIYVARKKGVPPLKAAIDGVTEVGMPIMASVTTIMVAFLPLLFVGGIMGKFIAILPMVVIACLVVSLIESIILLPAHLSHLPDPEPERDLRHIRSPIDITKNIHKFTSQGLEKFIDKIYTPFIVWLFTWRYVTFAVSITVFLITVGMMQSGIVKFSVFPKPDGDMITATVEYPDGTPLHVTEAAVKRLEDTFKDIASRYQTKNGGPFLVNTYSLAGATIFGDGGPQIGMTDSGNHLGSVRVEVAKSQDRDVLVSELKVLWETEVGILPGVSSVTFLEMSAGPPGAPIEIWLQGNNVERLHEASKALEAKLSTYSGVYQIRDDHRPGKNELKLTLKPEARALGLSVADLARQVFAGYYGEEAIRLQRGSEDIRVKVRYPLEERREMSEFERVRVRTPLGTEVPLLSVADISFGPGLTSVKRTDGMRRITVSADLDPVKANANEIFADLNGGFFQQLQHQYPGVVVSQQGEKKKMVESLGSLMISYPIALLGMFIIIAVAFRSYAQPLLIMITIPYGFIGAVIGHLLLGYELSMMSIFGIVALSGIVVNDSIVLIERINENLASGMLLRDAISQGAARRFRAIMLTSVSTVVDFLPLILASDMQAQFLIPMAISIASGVAFATMLTLIFIPCMFVVLNDIRRVFYAAWNAEWPTAEDVEPAWHRGFDRDGAYSEARAAAVAVAEAVPAK